MAKANFIPKGFHTATPYLIVRDAARAIEFYKKAFGATEMTRHADPGGKIRHAEIKIGDSPFMLTDEWAEFPEWQSPQCATRTRTQPGRGFSISTSSRTRSGFPCASSTAARIASSSAAAARR